AGFVNAVLRKSEREPNFNPLEELKKPLDKLTVETSHPRWLLEKWIASFGFEETAALARANNQTPPTAFRITGDERKAILEEIAAAGGEVIESEITPTAFRVSGANEKLRELVRAGKIYLQDEASQLVAATVLNLEPGSASREPISFLDVCAAPGSKTTQISSFKLQNSFDNNERGKNFFVAGDVHSSRIRILRETTEKFGKGKIEIVQYDASKSLPFAGESFDRVLVDAPCTGTGTIRHNPEIRWHLRETDFIDLQKRQSAILANAALAVKKGGELIYSTCSLEPEENETVVNKFLSQNPNFKQIAVDLPPKFLIGDAARTFPQRDDTDGFFIAAFQKQN
ncbi:MAG TPA: hypothetical protein VEX64_08780, partial [Pyrinomonadaceae bacterium]|nr:hypothetical protein [Pyrinomonadaceae bacterium]